MKNLSRILNKQWKKKINARKQMLYIVLNFYLSPYGIQFTLQVIEEFHNKGYAVGLDISISKPYTLIISTAYSVTGIQTDGEIRKSERL